MHEILSLADFTFPLVLRRPPKGKMKVVVQGGRNLANRDPNGTLMCYFFI